VCTVKNSDGGQRNCLKHVEFYSKSKFDILVHLVGFIIRTTSREFDPGLFNNLSTPVLIDITSHDEEYCESLIQLHKAEPFLRS